MGPDLKKMTPLPKSYSSHDCTVHVSGVDKVNGETIPRRNVKVKDGLKSCPHENVTTLYELLQYSSRTFGDSNALGWRKLRNTHVETKKVKTNVGGDLQEYDKSWTYPELSEYSYMSFEEFEQLALKLGSGLRNLGLERDDCLHLFAGTSPFWLAMAHGAMTQSMTIVTAYDTLGQEGVTHSLKQAHSKAIFVDPQLLPHILKPLDEAKDIKYVIYNSDCEFKQEHVDELKTAHSNVTILSFDDLKNMGEKNMVEPTQPKPDDVCAIMYTSGTTGTPKGVVLKHSNVIAGVAGVDVIVGDYIGPEDGLLTYLPLAHILEFVFENAILFWGATMGYGSPRSLSDQSVRNCKGDIREFRPTILVGVPAVWESIKKGILNKVGARGLVVKSVFWGAMAAKKSLIGIGLPGAGILDATIFKTVREATGGRLRICMNGGGPISKDTLRFISMVIAPMISGYGLTETCGMGALMDPISWTDQALGEIPGSIETKLVDFADAGYFSTNSPPQGEICIRGPAVIDKYLDLPDETKDSFIDGWFRTGDIGEFDSKGQLRIIDRKKNLVKMANGEYVALEKLESIYRSSPLALNVCVVADPQRGRPSCVVVPAEPGLKKLAADYDLRGEVDELIHQEKFQSITLAQLQSLGKKSGLASFEVVEAIVFADEEWTPQNEFVTSAQKVNRRKVLEKYHDQVKTAYGKIC